MNSISKNILAVIAGFLLGSVVNMGLVSVGPHVIPLPPGADVSDMAKLKASMALFEPKNFVFPWLAHALGTLAGAWLAARLAASHPMRCALVVGLVFLAGGITMVYLTGGPLWFVLADLVLAYLPMAYLGGKLGSPQAKTRA
ncbi:hypothetical protein [Marinicella meishanensis]|uniref:hypothetical protein n=1 Tax=Marinicella meishanensis TaxID=2873263 RepID=UPI001CC1AA2B|nr:hypothetical protein [Marinicella sp. NBU2979]